MNYEIVPFRNVFEDVKSMVETHYSDAKKNDFYEPLNVDWDYYLESSDAQQCYAIVCKKDEKIVGYSIFFISNDANHKDTIEAVNSGIYVQKEYRGKASVDLMRASDEIMKAIGVHKISYALKSEKLGRFLQKNGYKQEYKIWSKT